VGGRSNSGWGGRGTQLRGANGEGVQAGNKKKRGRGGKKNGMTYRNEIQEISSVMKMIRGREVDNLIRTRGG